MGHHLRCQPWPERPSTIGESRDSNNPQDNRNGSPAPAREPIVQEHSTQTAQAVKETHRQIKKQNADTIEGMEQYGGKQEQVQYDKERAFQRLEKLIKTLRTCLSTGNDPYVGEQVEGQSHTGDPM